MRTLWRSSSVAVANRWQSLATDSSENVSRWSASRNVSAHVSPWLQCAMSVQKHAFRHWLSVLVCANLPTG